MGLFTLSDDRILHLSGQRVNNLWQTTAELFEEDGSFIGSGNIESLSSSRNSQKSPIKYVWKDSSDKFYFIMEDGNTVVKVGEVEIGEG